MSTVFGFLKDELQRTRSALSSSFQQATAGFGSSRPEYAEERIALMLSLLTAPPQPSSVPSSTGKDQEECGENPTQGEAEERIGGGWIDVFVAEALLMENDWDVDKAVLRFYDLYNAENFKIVSLIGNSREGQGIRKKGDKETNAKSRNGSGEHEKISDFTQTRSNKRWKGKGELGQGTGGEEKEEKGGRERGQEGERKSGLLGTGSYFKGFENAGNTCYIDSVLFAMFCQFSAFDYLLCPTRSDDSGDCGGEDSGLMALSQRTKTPVALYQYLRFRLLLVVNIFRSGRIVTKSDMAELRNALVQCGWNSREGSNVHAQCDASEFFLFLLEVLNARSLSLRQTIHHGGEAEKVDENVISEMIIHLPVPVCCYGAAYANEPVFFVELLNEFFETHQVQRQRQVLPDSQVVGQQYEQFPGSAGGGGEQTPKAEEGHVKIVEGWERFSFLPAISERLQGTTSTPRADCAVVVPFCLKRYHINTLTNKIERISRPVVVPPEIDFSEFMMDPFLDGCGQNGCTKHRPYLALRSGVCHQGTSTKCGHYTAFSIDPKHGFMFKFDDLNEVKTPASTSSNTSRTLYPKISERVYVSEHCRLSEVTESMYNETSSNCFVLLYEYKEKCIQSHPSHESRHNNASTSTSLTHEMSTEQPSQCDPTNQHHLNHGGNADALYASRLQAEEYRLRQRDRERWPMSIRRAYGAVLGDKFSDGDNQNCGVM